METRHGTWFPLDLNGIVKSWDRNKFWLAVQRLVRIHDKKSLGLQLWTYFGKNFVSNCDESLYSKLEPAWIARFHDLVTIIWKIRLNPVKPGLFEICETWGGGRIQPYPVTPLFQGWSRSNLVVLHYIRNFVQQRQSFDDVITMTYLWRHLLFSVTFRWKTKTSPIFLKFSVGGNIEMLITKMGWDWQLTMILVEKLQFPMDFSKKFNNHSSAIVLPWQHWVSD